MLEARLQEHEEWTGTTYPLLARPNTCEMSTMDSKQHCTYIRTFDAEMIWIICCNHINKTHWNPFINLMLMYN